MERRRGEYFVNTKAADRGDADLAAQLRAADAAGRCEIADTRSASEISDACALLLAWDRSVGRNILRIAVDTRLRSVAQLALKTMRSLTREYQPSDASAAEAVLNDPQIQWRNTRRSRVPPKKSAAGGS